MLHLDLEAELELGEKNDDGSCQRSKSISGLNQSYSAEQDIRTISIFQCQR